MLRRDLLEEGSTDDSLYRAVSAGRLVRLRQGAYTQTEVWRAADAAERHRLLSHAVMRQYDDDVARSHVSALLEWGGPAWGLDLADAHVTSLHGIGERTGARLHHHRGALRVNDVTRLDGHWITTPARTAIDVALNAPLKPAVCVLDWVQNRGLATRAELQALVAAVRTWPGALGLFRKVDLSTALAESLAETLARLVFRELGLPVPELQFEVFDVRGRLIGRVDFAWPEHGLMGEFDGRVKYRRMRRPGETIEEMVLREKVREDRLREATGWLLFRLVWEDLWDLDALRARLIPLFERAA